MNDGRDEKPWLLLLLLVLGVVDRRVTAAHARTCPAPYAYSARDAHPYNCASAAAPSGFTLMLTPFNLQLNSTRLILLNVHFTQSRSRSVEQHVPVG